MTRFAWFPLVLTMALSSAGCLTSTPPPEDASSRDPEKTKGTGTRDTATTTAGPSNPGTGMNTEGGPGSLGEGLGAGSGTGSGSGPVNAGNANAAPSGPTGAGGPTGGR